MGCLCLVDRLSAERVVVRARRGRDRDRRPRRHSLRCSPAPSRSPSGCCWSPPLARRRSSCRWCSPRRRSASLPERPARWGLRCRPRRRRFLHGPSDRQPLRCLGHRASAQSRRSGNRGGLRGSYVRPFGSVPFELRSVPGFEVEGLVRLVEDAGTRPGAPLFARLTKGA